MLRSLFLILFAIHAVRPFVFGAPAENSSLTKAWLEVRSHERGVPKVEESVRLKMIAELTEAKGKPGSAYYGSPRINILLIDLGDEMTIKQYVEDYFGPSQRRSARDVLYASRQPSLVLSLGPFLHKDEPAKITTNGDEAVVPRSLAASQICLTLVQSCAEFDEQSRKWANQLQNKAGSRSIMRDQVRAFWLENESHLKIKNYQAVRPPSNAAANPPRAQPVISRTSAPPAVAVAAPASTSSLPTVIASNPPPTPVPAVAAIMKPAPIPPSSPTDAPPSDSSLSPPVWPWLLAVGIALGAVLWRRSH